MSTEKAATVYCFNQMNSYSHMFQFHDYMYFFSVDKVPYPQVLDISELPQQGNLGMQKISVF